jgi:hypothetical protein
VDKSGCPDGNRTKVSGLCVGYPGSACSSALQKSCESFHEIFIVKLESFPACFKYKATIKSFSVVFHLYALTTPVPKPTSNISLFTSHTD